MAASGLFLLTEILKELSFSHSFSGENWSGVDVMITIFGDFDNFRQKIGVLLKNQCYDQIFA
jgi:hypothetical protein